METFFSSKSNLFFQVYRGLLSENPFETLTNIGSNKFLDKFKIIGKLIKFIELLPFICWKNTSFYIHSQKNRLSVKGI